jgi:hypothetical protein
VWLFGYAPFFKGVSGLLFFLFMYKYKCRKLKWRGVIGSSKKEFGRWFIDI